MIVAISSDQKSGRLLWLAECRASWCSWEGDQSGLAEQAALRLHACGCSVVLVDGTLSKPRHHPSHGIKDIHAAVARLSHESGERELVGGIDPISLDPRLWPKTLN
jgi:hypothetical protein